MPGRGRGRLGAELALAVELSSKPARVSGGCGSSPAHNLDPLSRFEDPRNPRESPVRPAHPGGAAPVGAPPPEGHDRRRDRLAGRHGTARRSRPPSPVSSRPGWRTAGWAARGGCSSLPMVAVFALRLPTAGAALGPLRRPVHPARDPGGCSPFIELVLLMLLAGAALRRTTRALSALALDEERRDPNDAARARGPPLVTGGPRRAHHRPHLPAGARLPRRRVLRQRRLRVRGRHRGTRAACRAGLPPVFLAYRQTSWVELEAGNDLHARLFHARQDLPGATLLERALANRVVESSPARAPQPEVVATFPQGEAWPRVRAAETAPPPGPADGGAGGRSAAGFLSLLSALSPSRFRDRLNFLNQLFPIAIPETAAALAALGGSRADRAGPGHPPGPTTGLAGLPRPPDHRRRAAPGQRGGRRGDRRSPWPRPAICGCTGRPSRPRPTSPGWDGVCSAWPAPPC